MNVLQLVQGSDEWLKARSLFRTASEASAAAGCSKNIKRDDLLTMKKTRTAKEFSDWVQKNILDKGHDIEEQARPLAEAFIQKERGLDEVDAMLFPITATDDDGYLLASCDGLTDCRTIGWECKSWNKEKAELMRNGVLPECDKWQVVQQLVVTEAKEWLYTVTDGTEENTLHLWVSLEPGDATKLMAIWKQFDEDMERHEPKSAKPEPTAQHIDSLPAVIVELSGSVTNSNLPAFKQGVEQLLAQVPTELTSDQEFADAEAAAKAMKAGEKQLADAKKAALSRTADIEEVFRTIDDVADMLRQKRLQLEKLVKAEKEAKRLAVVTAAQQELAKHIEALTNSLGMTMPEVAADFGGVIKGKKTISSIQSAVNDELARAKIAANEQAEHLRTNLDTFNSLCPESLRGFLFADMQSLALKDPDAFTAIVQQRIAEHEAAVKAEAEAKAKAEAKQAEAPEPPPEQEPQPQLSELNLKSGSDVKQAAVTRTLEDALRTFCRTKNLGDQDAMELLDIVSHYQIDLSQAA